MPVDGVFLSLHGAAIATVETDPDGTLLAALRAIVGPDIPIIATLDLHANVSQKMVDHADVLVVYRTNPHVDMAERGAESAAHMRELLDGTRATAAFSSCRSFHHRSHKIPSPGLMRTSSNTANRKWMRV